MAIYDSVKNNPFLLNFAPWNNTIADDTTDEPVATTSGITSMYPYSQMSGGTGRVEGTPLTPRPSVENILASEDLGALSMEELYSRGILEPSEPNLLVKGVNWLTKRPTATESFSGGQGGIGSLAGVTMGEKGLLNELLAGGFLVNTPGGLKTTSGKNVVSMFGGYEEGQEEAYQNYLDEYGSLTGIKKAIATGKLKGAKLKRYNESKADYNYQNQQKIDTKKAKENVIKQKIAEQKIAEQEEATRVASVAKAIQQDINRGGRGDRDNTGRNEPGGERGQSPTGGDVSGTPFKHGGIVGVL